MTDQERKDAIRFFERVAEDEAMNYSRLAIEALKSQELKNVPDTNVGDMISRQAAIDALGDEPEVWSGDDEYAQGLNNQWHYDVNSLKAMPSVQPDIIACGDCKHYIPHDKRCGYWNHGVQPLMWCSQAERRTDE